MFDNTRLAIRSLALFVAMASAATLIQAQSPTRLVPVPPPPMGWSSWNSFSNTVNARVIMDQAKAMATSGLQKAGYQYINIDEGWWLGRRDKDGNILVNDNQWPGVGLTDKPADMTSIVTFIHNLGLKAGIYTDAGKDGCSMTPDLGPPFRDVGSEGHYEQDFTQFAKWGFDYVKVDWCGGDKENLDPAVQYAEIARAIAHAEKATGHHLFFSICNWGKHSPWTWAPHIGDVPADIWRTSGDIVDPIVAGNVHADRKASYDKMLANFDQGIHPEAQHTGAYNDPDMMVIGMPGLTDKQNRVHMSLWAISGAPLLVGADLTKISPATLETLTNPEVLAIDQDTAGLQAVKVAEREKDLQIWSKPLARAGSRAVLLLNRTDAEKDMEVRAADLGLADQAPMAVRDTWSRSPLGTFTKTFAVRVKGGDAVLLAVSGANVPSVPFKPEGVGPGRPLCHGCDYRFTKLSAHAGWARIRINYTNPDKTPRFAEMRVNAQNATRLAFPPTGSTPGAILVQAPFDRPAAANSLTLSPGRDAMPAIASIDVE
ncbi:alpha-galactosidase [Acidobacteria bacterium AB60]|nr:alpha-galactosidase [Acidobacteria bacterium AB60]